MSSHSCKICDGPVIPWTNRDLNASCNNSLPLIGTAATYLKCMQCGFLFAPYFDDWSKQQYLDNIYNEEYIKVDPEYDGTRSRRDANWFINNIQPKREQRILDYGAGNSIFEDELTKHGYYCRSWDPMWNRVAPDNWRCSFDIITSFEVFEHTPTPLETLLEIQLYLKFDGKLIFSTLVNDGVPQDFWYIAPRNGHVCMHSYNSLNHLFDKAGMTVQHHGNSLHIAQYK